MSISASCDGMAELSRDVLFRVNTKSVQRAKIFMPGCSGVPEGSVMQDALDAKKPPAGGCCDSGQCALWQRYLVQARVLADPAAHAGVHQADSAEGGVRLGAGADQVDAAACIAAMPVGVVVRQADSFTNGFHNS